MTLQFAQSLKAILYDELKSKGTLNREEIKEIARIHGYDESTAERRLRDDKNGEHTFVLKLNKLKKPQKESERIFYYVWRGPKNVYKKKYVFRKSEGRKTHVASASRATATH